MLLKLGGEWFEAVDGSRFNLREDYNTVGKFYFYVMVAVKSAAMDGHHLT